MRHRRIFLGLLLLLAAGIVYADGPSVSASQVWIREAAPGIEAMAGYLTLTNHTGRALALEQATSQDFGAVTLQNGTRAVKALTLAAHASVKLAPDGDHLVLTHPVKTLYAGDFITLSLTFSDGSSLTIVAPVRRNPPPD